MGLLRGSANFTRYFTDHTPSENDMDEVMDNITRFAFRNLDEHSDAERSTGWVNIMNMFDTDFTVKPFYMPPYIALSFRVDIRKVPPNALKQYCLEAENRIKAMEDLEYLPKDKRKELKDFTWHQLLKRAIPRSRTYDMIWNLNSSVLFFGATSDKICDEFAEHFSKTFGVILSPVFPYMLAYRQLEKDGVDTALLDGLKGADLST
ncbi:MAG: recombination-associated protein RdgC [Deltaproteobacteria bacterium]|nr:recombination-associated protein RdgC [Deltaproteobacteria bacterium]